MTVQVQLPRRAVGVANRYGYSDLLVEVVRDPPPYLEPGVGVLYVGLWPASLTLTDLSVGEWDAGTLDASGLLEIGWNGI